MKNVSINSGFYALSSCKPESPRAEGWHIYPQILNVDIFTYNCYTFLYAKFAALFHIKFDPSEAEEWLKWLIWIYT